MASRVLVTTQDGSHSIFEQNLNAHFHSLYGAIAESQHIYINHGLMEALKSKTELRIFEMGFGTGLNAYLSLLNAIDLDVQICYTTIEKEPLSIEMAEKLNFEDFLDHSKLKVSFMDLHKSEWNTLINFNKSFQLYKINGSFEDFQTDNRYDLIYYDAFGPDVQPTLWNLACLRKLYLMLDEDGFLITYCAKGQVKRDLKIAGFLVESLTGPLGKREITRARK